MIWRKVSCKWDAVQWLCRIFDPWGLMQMATAWGGILIRSQKCLSKEPKSHPLAEVQVVSKQGHHKRKGVLRNLGPGTSQLTPHRIWGLKLSFKILNRKKKVTVWAPSTNYQLQMSSLRVQWFYWSMPWLSCAQTTYGKPGLISSVCLP